MEALPLFDDRELASRYAPSEDICASRHKGSETSEEANEAIAPHKAEMRERILAFIRGRGDGGATTEEISRALGMKVYSVSGRVAELKHGGLVQASGERRPTSSCCSAAVIVAVSR